MSYVHELAAAHEERLKRLSMRSPAAGPLILKPQPKIYHFDKNGCLIRPKPPVPVFKFVPPLKKPTPPPLVPNRVSIPQVIREVAKTFEIGINTLLDKSSRLRHITGPRQVAMYLANSFPVGASLPAIGRRLGGYDHTTVLHARKVVAMRMAADAAFAAKVMQIQQTLSEAAGAP